MPAPDDVNLAALAQDATYVPFDVHKVHGNPATRRGVRSDASQCPVGITLEQAENWLRESIAAGDVGGGWLGRPFPKMAWKRIGDTVFEARLSNQEAGQYHGYPISPNEWPKWMS